MAQIQNTYLRWYEKVFGNEVMFNPGQRRYLAGPFSLDENKVFCHREICNWTSLDWDLHVRRSLRICLDGTYNRFQKIEINAG